MIGICDPLFFIYLTVIVFCTEIFFFLIVEYEFPLRIHNSSEFLLELLFGTMWEMVIWRDKFDLLKFLSFGVYWVF